MYIFRRKIEQIGEDERTINFDDVTEDGRDRAFEYLTVCIDRHNSAIEWDLIYNLIN